MLTVVGLGAKAGELGDVRLLAGLQLAALDRRLPDLDQLVRHLAELAPSLDLLGEDHGVMQILETVGIAWM